MTDRVSDLEEGEDVLVSPIRVTFALAKVVKPEQAGKVVVASRHGNEFVAAAEHVYALRPTHRSRAQADCYGACKPTSTWIPCLVTSVEGSQVLARDRDHQQLTLRSSEVIVFDPAVQEHVRAFFAETSYERAFRAQVEKLGGLRRPPNYRCTEGNVVLASFGEKHLLAQISDSAGKTCTVKWLTSSMKPSVRKVSEVVPLPTAYDKPPPLAPGDFVLAHARGKLSAKLLSLIPGSEKVRDQLPEELWAEWEPMRVEAVYPDGRLLLSDARQKQHTDTNNRVISYRAQPKP